MKTKFTFSMETSAYAIADNDFNRMFVENKEDYINDLLRYRGYVYLNQIYEFLGIAWDPRCDNVCYIHEDRHRLRLMQSSSTNIWHGFDINVMYI